MLVLSRRLNEKIRIPNIQATVQVVAIKSGSVRLGIEAPSEVVILREEVKDRMTQWGAAEAPCTPPTNQVDLQQVNQLLRRRLRISHKGLAELRRKLLAGSVAEAQQILDHIEEDFELLWERLHEEPPQDFERPAVPARATQALLVEDDPDERELLAAFLRISGLEVVTAGDGIDALNYLHSHGLPDLVLLDMGLPRCDGATVVREIRRDPNYSGLKIFAVSGHKPEEFDLSCGPTGVNRWFHKPIDPAELVRKVNQEFHGSLCRV